jgi:phosphotransferase system HPr-like phosphotransfer protein
VTSGRYIVDGKSMLGLFSLDLSQKVGVDYYGEDADADRFFKQLSAVLGAECVEG